MDLTKIRQVLFNLISNSAKFTERGTIKLKASREERDGKDWVTFEVSDTGIGIAEDKLNILFDEFTQADNSTTRNYGGTGLGLSITRRFCEMMGGNISVSSVLGSGSTFTILLPAELPLELTPKESPEESVIEPAVSSSNPDTKNDSNLILVIDDDPDMLEMMKKLLKKEGFSVATASNGEEGLKLAKELHPAAITLDVLMPRMDGWTVLKKLKADSDTVDIPVIVLTMAGDKSTGMSLGALEYLRKPVDKNTMLTILNKCCTDGSSRQVLVVEDDSTTRSMLKRILEKEDWNIIEAENGKVGLENLTDQVQVVILDLMMPELDGFGFLAQMRKINEYCDIPVIVMTAKDITSEDRQRLEDGVVTILQKGAYSREDLLGQIKTAVKRLRNS